MPGPTSKGTYIGRSKGAGLAAAAEKRAAAGYEDAPKCEECGRSMVCGQVKRHHSCRPGAA